MQMTADQENMGSLKYRLKVFQVQNNKREKEKHSYPIIFQKTGISLGFEREKIDFWKSDFVRFLFLLALLKIYVFPI